MQFSNKTELYQVIGSNIKYFREKASLTQIQLSEQLQINISYLSMSVLNHIANTLYVDVKYFLSKDNGVLHIK